MSLHLVKRQMFVLTAFAFLSGAIASPVRAVVAQAGVMAATASDDCFAMKMGLQCPISKSGQCKMAAPDCTKMMMSCDKPPGTMI